MQEPKRIPFDEFAHHLDEIFDDLAQSQGAILVEKEGRLYRLEKDYLHEPEDMWAGYDPDKVRQALRESAGTLKHIDHEALKRDIQEQRAQDSHGRPA